MNDVEFQKLLDTKPQLVLASKNYEYLLASVNWPDMRIAWFFILAITGRSRLHFIRHMLRWRQYSLTLNRDDFVIQFYKQSRKYRWDRASEFSPVTDIDTPNHVGFKELSSPQNDIFEGMPYIMPIGGLTVYQLAQLMNHWRERAVAGR